MKPVIDWDKAPSGTTHKGTREFGHVWYRYLDGYWSYSYCDDDYIPSSSNIWWKVYGTPLHLPLFARDDYVTPHVVGRPSLVDQLMTELELPSYQGFRELLDKLFEMGHLR